MASTSTTSTIELVDLACLWRNAFVTEPQRVHADTDAGHYHLVVPLSDRYEIEVFPRTHLFITREKGDENRVTRKEKQVLRLGKGQLLIFCSNLGHCGGRSSRIPADSVFQKNIGIQWFTGKNSDSKQITDISIHAGLQNKLFDKTIQSDYEAGSIKLIKVIFVEATSNKTKKDGSNNNAEYSEAQQAVSKQIKDARDELESIAEKGCGHMQNNEVFHFFDEATEALMRLKENKALIPESIRLRKRRR